MSRRTAEAAETGLRVYIARYGSYPGDGRTATLVDASLKAYEESIVEPLSDAYGEISAQLGIERLNLQRSEVPGDHKDIVERLTKIRDLLFAALEGTPRERPSEQYISYFQEDHTQDCRDAAFVHHATTGGDLPCICGAERRTHKRVSDWDDRLRDDRRIT